MSEPDRQTMQPDPKHLTEVLDAIDRVLVFCHMNPDPDSIASGLAMKHLLERRFGKEAVLTYRGIIGRAQNRQMVRLLVPELTRFTDIDEYDFGAAVLVDAQPQFGFNQEDLEELDVPVKVCIDHHPFVDSTASVPYHDVRPDVGATSTIMTSYLRLFSLEPTQAVATALYYGIRTDTLGLTRRTGDMDREAWEYLSPLVNHEIIQAIEAPPLSREYFQDLRDAIESARIYGNLVVSHLGKLPYPDMVAEIADLLLKLESASWSVCMGWFDKLTYVSVRTEDPDGDAGIFVREVVREMGRAGGHNTMAAARIPMAEGSPEEYERIRRELMKRILEKISVAEEDGVQLVA